MQGYVLEVKKYMSIANFCGLQLYHGCFWMDVALPCFPHHTKKNCSTPKNHHFSDPDAQKTMGQCHSQNIPKVAKSHVIA